MPWPRANCMPCAALTRLPGDERQAIELRLVGMTGREIAQELGRSNEEIKMLQQPALAHHEPLAHLVYTAQSRHSNSDSQRVVG